MRTGCSTWPVRWTPRTARLGYGPGDEGVMAFTDFGLDTLGDLIKIYKADPGLLKRSSEPQ